MKYIARNKENYFVQLEGEEEERNCFAVLVENLYEMKVCETYSGQIIEFSNKKMFKKFLLWRSIFNQCAPNKQFDFMLFARRAVMEVGQIMKQDLVEIG